jgi:hypothetical protein
MSHPLAQQGTFVQLATWYSLQRVDIIQLLSPLSQLILNSFCHSTSSRRSITLFADFSGLTVTIDADGRRSFAAVE